MHRTLTAETTRPPEWDLAQQQQRFDAFRHEFNTERPHEALAQETPASHYTSSPRNYPAQVPQPDYQGHLLVRRVGPSGSFKFRTREVFVSQVLRGEQIALEEVADGVWSVFFYLM